MNPAQKPPFTHTATTETKKAQPAKNSLPTVELQEQAYSRSYPF